MNQTMAFTTIPRPPSLLVPTKNPGRVSSAKGSYIAVRIHGSDPENNSVCSTGSRGLNRDGKTSGVGSQTYETAKGVHEKVVPSIEDFLQIHGEQANLQISVFFLG
ncbi:hypothetical protein V6N11_070200 [Hibiscus sabdariffa]|uniref:Uncharacterized protein n=1 Tax=Hibiscus sabdariffa TaxID=183260 RepID=A0ABR2QEA5_9ROSI